VQGDISEKVYHCWGAVMWIVVFGAPIGSYVLNKERETFFRRLFYFLAVAQFAVFACLKIKGKMDAWLVIFGMMVLAAFSVTTHYILAVRVREQAAPALEAVKGGTTDTKMTKDDTPSTFSPTLTPQSSNEDLEDDAKHAMAV